MAKYCCACSDFDDLLNNIDVTRTRLQLDIIDMREEMATEMTKDSDKLSHLGIILRYQRGIEVIDEMEAKLTAI